MNEKTNILIVDDEPENLMAMEALLKNENINIIKAGSGDEALGLTSEYDFALIILDIHMPELNGFETAVILRARKKTRHIPLIFITTTLKEQKHIFKGYEKAPVDYLIKPIMPHILKSKVRLYALLDKQRKKLEQASTGLNGATSGIKKLKEALIKSEARYRLLLENASDAIIVIQDEKIKFYNKKTINITGFSGKDLEEMPFLEYIHPKDQDMIWDRHEKMTKGEKPPGNGILTCRLINAQGEIVWAEIKAIPIFWEERPAILCFIRDITKRKKFETNLQQAHKMEAIGTLAGGIAHDFNNILGVIIGYSEMAIQEINDIELVKHNLDHVLKASNRAKELVKQILTFSHKNELGRKPIILNPIVKETLKLLRASLPKTIAIKESIPTELLVAKSNPTQIHQVLMNLCTNSAHAMEDKGGTLTVKMEPFFIKESEKKFYNDLPCGSYVKIIVRDTGHGIDPSIMKKIFDPYFTTKPMGKGTGMGLAVVHGIIKGHKGTIRVESRPGKTTFEVLLPRISTTCEIRDEKKQAKKIFTGNKKILFVDDEVMLARLGEKMLDGLGYTVDCHFDPAMAFESFKKDPFSYHLVITDMTMPKMTGDVLAKKIMQLRPDIPIIICTGYSERISPEKAKKMGVKSLLFKPLAVDNLAIAVQDAIISSLSDH